MAKLMTWHIENISSKHKIQGPYDSLQFELVERIEPTFNEDGRNTFMAMCANGVCPFGGGGERSAHSLWPTFFFV